MPSPRASDSTSSSLLRRLQASDPTAWQRLVDLYSPLVWSWCRERLPAEDAADVAQEIFTAVAAGIGSFRHDQPDCTFRGWLRSIAQHKIADRLRQTQREPAAAGGTDAQRQMQDIAADDPTSTVDHVSAGSWASAAKRALALIQTDFQPKTWRAFMLAAVEGRPTAEVAAELDMTPAAVRQAKSKVLHRLRRELGDLQ